MPLQETNTYTPDQLISGDYPQITEPETLIAGQNLARGAVLGRITVGGKLTLALAAAVDGSDVPVAILPVDADASAADLVVPVYKSGQFDPNFLVYGTGIDAAATKTAFEGTPMFLRTAV